MMLGILVLHLIDTGHCYQNYPLFKRYIGLPYCMLSLR